MTGRWKSWASWRWCPDLLCTVRVGGKWGSIKIQQEGGGTRTGVGSWGCAVTASEREPQGGWSYRRVTLRLTSVLKNTLHSTQTTTHWGATRGFLLLLFIVCVQRLSRLHRMHIEKFLDLKSKANFNWLKLAFFFEWPAGCSSSGSNKKSFCRSNIVLLGSMTSVDTSPSLV